MENDMCDEYAFEPGVGGILTRKKFEHIQADVFSKPLGKSNLIELIKFYSEKERIKLKYESIMYNLEEKHPSLYNMLTSIGFPKLPEFPPLLKLEEN